MSVDMQRDLIFEKSFRALIVDGVQLAGERHVLMYREENGTLSLCQSIDGETSVFTLCRDAIAAIKANT